MTLESRFFCCTRTLGTSIYAVIIILLFSSAVASASSRPNILLIVSEDNGPQLGCYGDRYARTPALDQLASSGARFERAYCAQAGCSQSRAAMLTGTYPHQNGQIGLASWTFRMYREDTPNIVHSLREAGYQTGIIGKLHIRPPSAFPFHFKRSDANFVRKDLARYAVWAKEFFSSSDKPFFLSVNYPDAHRPFLAQVDGLPKHPIDSSEVSAWDAIGLDTPELRTQIANYYNCISRLDTLVGDLLEALEESGKAQNTLIVYLGDHGHDLLRGKRTSYEGGVKVPLIVSWPGVIPPGQVRTELVSLVDLVPTLLDATHTERRYEVAGASLLPLLRDQPGSWRKYLFTEFHTHSAKEFYPQRTVRNSRFKLIHNLMPHEVNPGYEDTIKSYFDVAGTLNAIQSAPADVRAAYERMRAPPEFELYDLATDPHEFRSLAGSPKHASILAELQSQLAQWREATNDPLLFSDNLTRLKQEIDACFRDGKASKARLNLTYPQYFHSDARGATSRIE